MARAELDADLRLIEQCVAPRGNPPRPSDLPADRRHDLHQPTRAGAGGRAWIEAGFLPDECRDERRIERRTRPFQRNELRIQQRVGEAIQPGVARRHSAQHPRRQPARAPGEPAGAVRIGRRQHARRVSLRFTVERVVLVLRLGGHSERLEERGTPHGAVDGRIRRDRRARRRRRPRGLAKTSRARR